GSRSVRRRQGAMTASARAGATRPAMRCRADSVPAMTTIWTGGCSSATARTPTLSPPIGLPPPSDIDPIGRGLARGGPRLSGRRVVVGERAGTGAAQVGTWALQMGTWSAQMGTWSAQMGTWSAQMGMWSAQHGTWTLHVGMWSAQMGTWSFQHGMWSAHTDAH